MVTGKTTIANQIEGKLLGANTVDDESKDKRATASLVRFKRFQQLVEKNFSK
jgi:hypothetical protein